MPTNVPDRELRGSDFRVGISPQVDKGVINANPVFATVRRREGKASKVVNYEEDPTVNNRMQATEQIQDTEDLAAELVASFSKQSVGWLIQAIHSGEQVVTITEDDIAATATGFTSAGGDFGPFTAGDAVWVSGFDNDENDGFYLVVDATATTLTTYPAPPALESAGEVVTVSMRKASSADSPTYNTIQTAALDLSKPGDTDYYTLYDAVLNTLSVEIGETGTVTATGAFVAEREVPGHGAISGQSYTPAQTDRAVSSRRGAPSAVEAFYVNGVDATCTVKSVSLEVNNQYQRDDAAGCNAFYTRGQFQVTGSLVARTRVSNPFVWRDRSYSSDRTSLGFLMRHSDGGQTYVVIRQSVVTEHTMPDGNNVAANSEVSFVAEEHIPTASTIAVYRDWE